MGWINKRENNRNEGHSQNSERQRAAAIANDPRQFLNITIENHKFIRLVDSGVTTSYIISK